MPNPINPYPQAKSETSAESILDVVILERNKVLQWIEDLYIPQSQANRLYSYDYLAGEKYVLEHLETEIRRRITAEAERRAKAFGGTEL